MTRAISESLPMQKRFRNRTRDWRRTEDKLRTGASRQNLKRIPYHPLNCNVATDVIMIGMNNKTKKSYLFFQFTRSFYIVIIIYKILDHALSQKCRPRGKKHNFLRDVILCQCCHFCDDISSKNNEIMAITNKLFRNRCNVNTKVTKYFCCPYKEITHCK